MAITKIRVPASWRGGLPGNAFHTKEGIAEFSLGVGPCGKLVDELTCEIEPHGVAVGQSCGDEFKLFFYPTHTLTGRIEITENNS